MSAEPRRLVPGSILIITCQYSVLCSGFWQEGESHPTEIVSVLVDERGTMPIGSSCTSHSSASADVIILRSFTNRCANTSWYGILSFGVCTFIAQVVLTLRLDIPFVFLWLYLHSREFHHRAYAITMKSVPVVIGFGAITVTQLSVGVWLLVVSVKAGGKV